jgi:hypothetical protein
MMERFAPKTAAFDTPRVEGEAIGFERSVCIMRPDTESPAPAIKAASIRGSLIFQIILIMFESPVLKRAPTPSEKLISDEPRKREAKAVIRTAIMRIMIAISFFFLLCKPFTKQKGILLSAKSKMPS